MVAGCIVGVSVHETQQTYDSDRFYRAKSEIASTKLELAGL